MGQGKNHMEIRGIDHFRTAFVNPDLLVYSLAVGAITVAAGIIVCRITLGQTPATESKNAKKQMKAS